LVGATRGVLTFAGLCLILPFFAVALTLLLLAIAIALCWISLIATLRLVVTFT
jgi:hypothetical protein